jgi:hypothetical protein
MGGSQGSIHKIYQCSSTSLEMVSDTGASLFFKFVLQIWVVLNRNDDKYDLRAFEVRFGSLLRVKEAGVNPPTVDADQQTASRSAVASSGWRP